MENTYMLLPSNIFKRGFSKARNGLEREDTIGHNKPSNQPGRGDRPKQSWLCQEVVNESLQPYFSQFSSCASNHLSSVLLCSHSTWFSHHLVLLYREATLATPTWNWGADPAPIAGTTGPGTRAPAPGEQGPLRSPSRSVPIVEGMHTKGELNLYSKIFIILVISINTCGYMLCEPA